MCLALDGFGSQLTRSSSIELLRAKEVVVDGEGLFAMADGEELGAVPLTLRAVGDCLTIYAPAPA